MRPLFCELCGEPLGEEGLCDYCDRYLAVELSELDLDELYEEWLETKRD